MMQEVSLVDVNPTASNPSVIETNENRQESRNERTFPTKLVLGLVFLALIVYIVIDSFTTQYVTGAVQIFLEWFENNVIAGAFLFIVGKCSSPHLTT